MGNPQRLLTETQTCEYLSVSRSFLAKARMNGTLPGHTPGPPYIKLGRSIRYDLSDLDAWVREHRHAPTHISQTRP